MVAVPNQESRKCTGGSAAGPAQRVGDNAFHVSLFVTSSFKISGCGFELEKSSILD